MPLAFIVLAIATGLELLLWLPALWRWRKIVASLIIVVVAATSGLLFGAHLNIWFALLLVLSGYRVVNLLRLVEGRTQADYLFRVARNTSWWLISAQLLLLAALAFNQHHQFAPPTWWYLFGVFQLIGGLILLLSTLRHLRTTRPRHPERHYADHDLPTLTVALPARNETDDLEACLQSLLTSDYPKLEILVLDDCSQNKHTPEIIRGFAQGGVRFIAGQAPPRHWLAKNYAYQQLVEQANGEILLFCGVDARFELASLRQMVEVMLSTKKPMLSLLPRNRAPGSLDFGSSLVQPSRYAWELALPRRLLNRPPVLSTCWLISAEALHAAGTFKAVSRSNSPESYFARSVARQNDGYSFLSSGEQIGLSSIKGFSEQRATAIRTRYPQLHRRPELVALSVIAELVILVMPIAGLVYSALTEHWLLFGLSALNTATLLVFYSKIVNLTYRKFLLRGLWLLPFAALYDIALLHYSMWQYEFREVIWKGRNVCIPVMRTFTSLPKLPDKP